MPVSTSKFLQGEVFIDYPQEEVMFHFDPASKRILRRFYDEDDETEIEIENQLYADAIRFGEETTAERYQSSGGRAGRPVSG